jgi:hypothetical protein
MLIIHAPRPSTLFGNIGLIVARSSSGHWWRMIAKHELRRSPQRHDTISLGGAR